MRTRVLNGELEQTFLWKFPREIPRQKNLIPDWFFVTVEVRAVSSPAFNTFSPMANSENVSVVAGFLPAIVIHGNTPSH